MTQPGVVPERLAHAAASWAQIAAGHVPSLPVRPETSASYPAHVIATICVEVVQPLTGLAARWTDDGSTSVLGRVDIRIRHLESAEKKIGRDLGIAAAAAETRALLSELGVRSTAAKREGGAPSAFFESSVDPAEALLARQALLDLATALRQGAGGSSRKAGTPEYRLRDAPAVLAFWSMKVESCSPGITQRLPLRLARRSPRKAIEEATAELLARLRAQPADIVATDRATDLIALCERTLADLD